MEASGRIFFINHYCWIRFFFLLSILAISRSDSDCVYTAYVQTGSKINGGTDSNISLTLYDANNDGLRIGNIETWGGLMGKDHDYFERGNLDIFSGRGPCLTAPVCGMNLTSDGSGLNPGWFCNYVKVTTATVVDQPCSEQLFTVDQWLDFFPSHLSAIRDNCGNGKKSAVDEVSAAAAVVFDM